MMTAQIDEVPKDISAIVKVPENINGSRAMIELHMIATTTVSSVLGQPSSIEKEGHNSTRGHFAAKRGVGGHVNGL